MSAIDEKKSQSGSDQEEDDIEKAFWAETSNESVVEDTNKIQAAQPQIAVPQIPGKVQNPHKMLLQEMPRRVAFAQ